MTKRFPASVISGTPVVPNLASAPGVWTKEQQIQAQAQGLWPINPSLPDPYFPYVSLLLHGDGTNGATNNTFLDSSANNFTITRNGNTSQGSYSPFGTLWSNYFDGTGDYLTVANNAAFALGTGAFTIEFWFNAQTVQSTNIFDMRSTGTEVTPVIYISNNVPIYYVSGAAQITSGAALSPGVWYHIAVSRSGTSTKMFVNGTQVGSTYTDSNSYVADQIGIGGYVPTASSLITGSVSNLRIVKGTALYTANFTPPGSPLTAITNTVLLTCQSNRIKDNSATGATITRNGDVTVSRFSPFAPGAVYNTSTIGGSAYFDGTGDYLSATLTAQTPGTGNFTYECFFWVPSVAASRAIMNTRSGNTSDGFDVLVNTSGAIVIAYAAATLFTSANSLVTGGQWYHLAVVRTNTSTVTIYLNGAAIGSWSSGASTNFTSTTLYVGATALAGVVAFGYISNFRYCNSAIYTTSFTPPTAPLAAVATTQFLSLQTNAGIFDNAMLTDLETVGTAQINTTTKKYGTGSIFLNGAGNRLSAPLNMPQFAFGGGDFTVEAWVYPTASGTGTILFGQGDGASIAGASYVFYISSSTTTSDLYVGGGTIYSATSPNAPLNQWSHVAYVRYGTSFKTYLNGTQVGSATLAANTVVNVGTATYPASVGITGASASPLTGYIDDLRVTKGVARYTGPFTPPTAAFSSQ